MKALQILIILLPFSHKTITRLKPFVTICFVNIT